MKHRISHKKYNGHRVYRDVYDPYNPLDLPPYTMRLKLTDDYVPYTASYYKLTQVSSSPNIWDLTCESNVWGGILLEAVNGNLLEVMGANTTNLISMDQMFSWGVGKALTSVALFDTSNVSSMNYMFNTCDKLSSVPLYDTNKVSGMTDMFNYCSSLTSIPLFDTSNVTQMDWAFNGCTNVQSGALALYQQASSQSNPPRNHLYTFSNCGTNTQTGSAELAQIPDSWK